MKTMLSSCIFHDLIAITVLTSILQESTNLLLLLFVRYHVPRSWFQPSGNTLVIFEEKGGDPTKISFGRRRATGLCSFRSEDYPSMDLESWDKAFNITSEGSAAFKLACPGPEGSVISSIKFASYGNPSGSCGNYSTGTCHYPNTQSVMEKVIFYTSIISIRMLIKFYFKFYIFIAYSLTRDGR